MVAGDAGVDAGLTDELVAELRRAGVVEVDASPLTRALYASDASLYRVPPRAVARPRHADDVVAALDVCRRLGVPLTARGAGTSIAGNAIGPGLVLDLSRHLHRVRGVDPESRTAVVEPGVVQADLQRAAAPYGLRFGPDPSTADRCTIGGMIGNDACGTRALAYGRTSDSVVDLDVLLGTGTRLRSTRDPAAEGDALRQRVADDLATVRTEFGRFARQGSGYRLEHLLPERGGDLARALVGSEGTLGVVLAATVRLVADPRHRTLLVLGYPSMAEAADAVPAVLPHRPTACEGLDARIVDAVRRRRAGRAGPGVPPLPTGSGWLFVELTGATAAEAAARAAAVVPDSGASDALVVTDAGHAAALWRIRGDGAGLAARTPDGRPAHPGWEDAAVPPERLGTYLRQFDELLAQHGLSALPYGHFGDGCLHVRVDVPLGWGQGTRRYRAFVLDAAALVARHGGSFSGEHGDGRARSELLPLMYSPAALALMADVERVCDPDGVLGPGVLVDPRPLDADLRSPAAPPLRRGLGLAHRRDGGDLTAAVHRCTGVGTCRADPVRRGGGDVMCPSYVATREEQDTTRGRARVLQELVRDPTPEAWRAPEVHAALDLCLGCKGCARDCPTGVDLASYRIEVLHQAYRRRVRPRSHYTLGRLPRWAALASRAPALANLAVRLPGARRAAGIDPRRSVPRFAPEPFSRWAQRRPPPPDGAERPAVVLWVDTFTEHFTPQVGVAAVQVLERAGYAVRVPSGRLCCGLTELSTGQLGAARRSLGRTVAALGRASAGAGGAPIVGLEPSCTAVLRDEAFELLPTERVEPVAATTRTLAELLRSTPAWSPPRLDGPVVAQPHCHHHAVLGWDADAALLAAAGAQVRRVGGCCGLAGDWGMTPDHYDVSRAIAEHALLPAVREAPGATVLADGFSCRTQLADLAGREALHLAELLAGTDLDPEVPRAE